ncbi:hypothetical protein MTR_8g063770 [Medicago truncatula]|uniref:Uncharacterized protein n=1 Tax=Medicago truncatula TaxID=3880 RepID=A0A072TR30_MEDTR|nr:hypothetical protein MTR_8g063770 [Medicago truncatula]
MYIQLLILENRDIQGFVTACDFGGDGRSFVWWSERREDGGNKVDGDEDGDGGDTNSERKGQEIVVYITVTGKEVGVGGGDGELWGEDGVRQRRVGWLVDVFEKGERRREKGERKKGEGRERLREGNVSISIK